MPVKIKEEGRGMLKPRDAIARERGEVLPVSDYWRGSLLD